MTKITNAQISPTSRQSGWGYVTFGSSSNSANIAVTFPTAFSAPPKVIACALGWKTGAAPTAVSDFTSAYGGGTAQPVLHIINITATGFTVYQQTPSSTFGSSYGGFTWIAEA